MSKDTDKKKDKEEKARIEPVQTKDAPAAIGPYSQAVRVGDTLYCSGQIALHAQSGELLNSTFEQEVHQVFHNLAAVVAAGGGGLERVAKLTLYLTDLGNFAIVNQIMAEYFKPPYPARATVGVVSLPKGARFEADAIVALG